MELVQALMAGARGRRMLWEFATASEEKLLPAFGEHPLHAAMFYAAYHVAVERGESVGLFGADESSMPETSVQQIARRLDSTTLVPATAALLQQALVRSVDSARYWQEPDGEDTLLALPELAAPLERVARHLADSGLAAGWMDPVDLHNQFQVEFNQHDPQGRTQAPGSNALGLLQEWRAGILATEARDAAEMSSTPLGSFSGEWWSKPSSRLPSTTGVFPDREPVGLSCVEDGFGWEQASVRFTSVPPAAKVLEIATAEDWIRLCREHGIEVTAHKRHDWYLSTGRDGAWKIPDWLAVARDYDGVHLGIGAYLALAGQCLDIDDKYASVIAGWDPDQTFWFIDELRCYGPAQEWICLDANNEDARWVPSGDGPSS
ncbi:MAG: hypothetical protein ACTJGO_14975 [Glutamicibacter arilaitensis]|uniref:hypothetical protein n=1 Tax=Glutamicibacter arilaitensis TaxID=256701 RepID=UPI003FD2E4F6